MVTKTSFPVIDLFAGPGGLGEGFSSLVDDKGNRRFKLGVSIEKDEVAHRTLSLRALFRAFNKDHVPDCYYDYLRGDISRSALFAHPSVPDEARYAASEAKHAELGKTPVADVDAWITSALNGANEWALIGGPPCQAYSVAGRSRRTSTKEDLEKFENDEKHFLYKEYLRVIRKFAPSVFVMENVKGILTSTHKGSPIFQQILADLSSPGNGLEYRIRSFVVNGEGAELDPSDFVIHSERYGVPQSRHRVILFGIRADVAARAIRQKGADHRYALSPTKERLGVTQALSGLPPLRSRLSKGMDSHKAWLDAVQQAQSGLKGWRSPQRAEIEVAMGRAFHNAQAHTSYGEKFTRRKVSIDGTMPKALRAWFLDPKLGGVLQHESRSHMPSDLQRYVFAACYANLCGTSPDLTLFPPRLLPDHANVDAANIPFSDRFRVQRANLPSTTVVAHIAKDGHYYIHPDPSQARSLTVREAARLQTFPDNYFFEGNRTEQYTQVGNAVPPWLAKQIAEVVLSYLEGSKTL
jgi:DNA (cytosine-5)-methyltransferase 1